MNIKFLIGASLICAVFVSSWIISHADHRNPTESTRTVEIIAVAEQLGESQSTLTSWPARNSPSLSNIGLTLGLAEPDNQALAKLLKEYESSVMEVREKYTGDAVAITKHTKNLLFQKREKLEKLLGKQRANVILSTPSIIATQNRSLVFGAGSKDR